MGNDLKDIYLIALFRTKKIIIKIETNEIKTKEAKEKYVFFKYR